MILCGCSSGMVIFYDYYGCRGGLCSIKMGNILEHS